MRELIKWITDYIKTGNNSGLKMCWAEICLFMGFYYDLFNFKVFINIHKSAN